MENLEGETDGVFPLAIHSLLVYVKARFKIFIIISMFVTNILNNAKK